MRHNYESYSKLLPEDPLSQLPIPGEFQKMFQVQRILTIRHFAMCNLNDLYSLCNSAALKQEINDLHSIAGSIVFNSSYTKPQEKTAEVWGYVYVSEEVYEYAKKEKELRSAYVLFQEYVNTPVASRQITHPWMHIYHTYSKDAAAHCGSDVATDLDVYSYLVWRASSSFANLDYTAGVRAIYFNWWCLKTDGHKYCLAVDKMLANQLDDPLLEHRNDRVLQINLTAVVKHCQGKLYRFEPNVDKTKWLPTSMEEARERASDYYRMQCTVNPGENFYGSNFPHGCIVTPTGTISADYISVSEKQEADAGEGHIRYM